MTVAFSVPLVLVTTDLNIFSLIKEEKKIAAVGADLETAQKIQMDALPVNHPAFPDHLNVSLNAFIKTAKECGFVFRKKNSNIRYDAKKVEEIDLFR